MWFCWFCTPVQRFWPWFYSGFAGFARLPPKANVQYLGLGDLLQGPLFFYLLRQGLRGRPSIGDVALASGVTLTGSF